MKFICTLILFVACSMLGWATTTFTFSPSSPTVVAGQSFTIDLLATTDGMYAFQGELDFTPGILQVDAIDGMGDFAGLFGFDPVDNVNGVVTNVFGSWTGTGITIGTDIVVARISITALASGSASLLFTPSLVVANPDSFDIDPNISSSPGGVTVVDAPEPSALSLVAFVGALSALRRISTKCRNRA